MEHSAVEKSSSRVALMLAFAAVVISLIALGLSIYSHQLRARTEAPRY